MPNKASINNHGITLLEIVVGALIAGGAALWASQAYLAHTRAMLYQEAVQSAQDANHAVLKAIAEDLRKTDFVGMPGIPGLTPPTVASPMLCVNYGNCKCNCSSSSPVCTCANCPQPTCAVACSGPSCKNASASCLDATHCPSLGVVQTVDNGSSAADSQVSITYDNYCVAASIAVPGSLQSDLANFGSDCMKAACPSGQHPVISAVLRSYPGNAQLSWTDYPTRTGSSVLSTTAAGSAPQASVLCVDPTSYFQKGLVLTVETAIVDARSPQAPKLVSIVSHLTVPWPVPFAAGFTAYRKPSDGVSGP